MEKRQLGNTGIEVAPLMLGGNVFGWTVDEAGSFQILDAFVEAGLNFIDTADVYSRWIPGNQGGESETIIGKWFRQSGQRHRVVLATKVGMELGPDKKGLSPQYIASAVEDSLRRLQTDHIDLYQSHKDDDQTPLDETLRTYEKLIQDGKVLAIGASNYTAARLSEALETSRRLNLPSYRTLQPEYNLLDRAGFEKELEPLCQEHGLGVVSYFSLASGFLSGKYRSEADLGKSPRGQIVKKYLNERGFRVLDALDQVAQKHGSTPARVALAWLIARPTITAPIASATTLEQLNELIESVELKLDAAEIETLSQASAEQVSASA